MKDKSIFRNAIFIPILIIPCDPYYTAKAKADIFVNLFILL